MKNISNVYPISKSINWNFKHINKDFPLDLMQKISQSVLRCVQLKGINRFVFQNIVWEMFDNVDTPTQKTFVTEYLAQNVGLSETDLIAVLEKLVVLKFITFEYRDRDYVDIYLTRKVIYGR